VKVLVAYNKPPGGSFWGLACTVANPSSLIASKTLTAIWTSAGDAPCQ
jgi:hypothetical protein